MGFFRPLWLSHFSFFPQEIILIFKLQAKLLFIIFQWLYLTDMGPWEGCFGFKLTVSFNVQLTNEISKLSRMRQKHSSDRLFWKKYSMHRKLKKWYLLKYTLWGFMWINDPLPEVLLFLSEKQTKKNPSCFLFLSLEIIVTGAKHTISLLNLQLLKILFLPDIIIWPQKITRLLLQIESHSTQTLNR